MFLTDTSTLHVRSAPLTAHTQTHTRLTHTSNICANIQHCIQPCIQLPSCPVHLLDPFALQALLPARLSHYLAQHFRTIRMVRRTGTNIRSTQSDKQATMYTTYTMRCDAFVPSSHLCVRRSRSVPSCAHFDPGPGSVPGPEYCRAVARSRSCNRCGCGAVRCGFRGVYGGIEHVLANVETGISKWVITNSRAKRRHSSTYALCVCGFAMLIVIFEE